jgi:uncharacterized membrane protein YdfJ with MMPL/SSD domain
MAQTTWNVLAIAAAFLVALGVQSFLQKRVRDAAVRRYWKEKVEDSWKLLDRNVTGIIVALSITNALLAAILAVLILRP